MIHAIKLVRNVFSVKPIPNHIPHIKIAKSTQRIQRVMENHTASIAIFTVLLITQMSSSFPASHQRDHLSRYQNSLFLAIFETIKVSTIAKIANIILSNTCVEKTDKSVLRKSVVWLTSASHAAKTDDIETINHKKMKLIYFFIYVN